jgi:hypothetical protein
MFSVGCEWANDVATKATVEIALRKRIEQQLKDKNITELIGLSRQLN